MKMHTTMIAPPAMQEIDINLVQARERLRDVDQAQVKALALSIADVGLLNPITVYRHSITRDRVTMDGFAVIAGAHRLAAYESLGYAKIPAIILDMGELHRTIAECDENLCGPKLTPAERALFTNRRKEAYEQLHPETVQHVAGGKARHGAASDNLSFAEATAAATGRDVRSVQRDAARGKMVSDGVIAMVKGTKLDTGAYLDKLTRLPESEQERRMQDDLETLEAEKGWTPAAKATLTGNARKKKKEKTLPDRTADPAGYFVWLLEELSVFSRTEIEGWQTTDRAGQQTLARKCEYARSAARIAEHFLTTHAGPGA